MFYEDDYNNEPYYEPTVADEILIEYQQKMKDALLDSVKSSIENTKSENTRLKEENKKLRDSQNQVEQKQRVLDAREKTLESSLESNFYRKKFSELLKPFEEQYSGYYAVHTYKMKRKCKDCDENRKVTYTSLKGDIVQKDCLCLKNYAYYVPKHSVIQILNLYKSDSYEKKFGITPKYQDRSGDDYRWNKLEFTQLVNVFDESVASDLDDTLFSSKEECKKYCDWLNRNVEEDIEEEE